uniref:Uncharacterized protein n=1 Tax=Zea mays TaxID=4577 RepID=A0A804MGP4_MAIZE
MGGQSGLDASHWPAICHSIPPTHLGCSQNFRLCSEKAARGDRVGRHEQKTNVPTRRLLLGASSSLQRQSRRRGIIGRGNNGGGGAGGHGGHVHGVAPEHPEEGRVLLDLGQRVLRAGLCEGRLEVDVEHVLEVLGGADVGVVDEADGAVAVRPALDLGERDVAEGEGGEHLEEHGGALPVVREHDAGLEGAVGARHDGLPGQHHEAGDVAGVVLDAVRQHLHPVQLGGAGGRDGGRVAEAVGGHVLGGAGRVVEGLADDVEAHGRERVLALRQRLRVAHHAGQALLAHPGQRQQAVVHGELHLPDDVEPVPEQQVVVAVDAAAQRVLHGEHGAVRDPQLHGLERHLELVAGDGVAARVRLPGRLLAVRAGHALVGHAQLRPVHRRRGQVRDAKRLRQVLGDGAIDTTTHGDQIQHRPVLSRRRGRGRRDVAVDGVRTERGHLAGQHGAAALPLRPPADDRALQRAPHHASAPPRGVAREPRILPDRRPGDTRCSHCDTDWFK